MLAALRALQESHDPSGTDKASLRVDCLALVIRQLAGEDCQRKICSR
jgi:hypothetical protein